MLFLPLGVSPNSWIDSATHLTLNLAFGDSRQRCDDHRALRMAGVAILHGIRLSIKRPEKLINNQLPLFVLQDPPLCLDTDENGLSNS